MWKFHPTLTANVVFAQSPSSFAIPHSTDIVEFVKENLGLYAKRSDASSTVTLTFAGGQDPVIIVNVDGQIVGYIERTA